MPNKKIKLNEFSRRETISFFAAENIDKLRSIKDNEIKEATGDMKKVVK